MTPYKIQVHITPETAMMEMQEKDSYDKMYILPVGPKMINEMNDVIYIKDADVPYHEHPTGYETFLIDGGSVDMIIQGKHTVAHEGDMIHIQPYMAHAFHILEEGTIWREMFQEIDMYAAIQNKILIQTNCPELMEDAEFMKEYRRRNSNVRLPAPKAQDVDKHEVPQIRCAGEGIATFEFEDILCRLKIGRWETNGVKEIWEFVMKPGYEVEWNIPHNDWDLFVVNAGSIRVEVEGEETFVAKRHDIVNIPPYSRHKITVLEEGASLLAYNCQSLLLRALGEIEALADEDPTLLKDWARLEEILRRNECMVTGCNKV